MRDHTPIKVKNIKGVFANGSPHACPTDRLLVGHNLLYYPYKVGPRPGLSVVHTFANNILRVRVFRYKGTNRLMVLDDHKQLFDCSTSIVTPIYTFTEAGSVLDFQGASIFDRYYFGATKTYEGFSLSTSYCQVYQPTLTVRPMAGLRPTAVAGLTGAYSASGKIESGTHVWGVVYETDSGFLTAPGPVIAGVLTLKDTTSALDNRLFQLSGIPTGPTGTAKRHIITTKAIKSYSGNPLDYRFYFIPNGVIADNVTTVLAGISFYDADLQNSADYLFYVAEYINSGAVMTTYGNRLVVSGQFKYADILGGSGTSPILGPTPMNSLNVAGGDPNVVWISNASDPETFSLPDSYLMADPQETGGVRNAFDFRGTLFLCKPYRLYAATDNGDVPTLWPVNALSKGNGADAGSVGQILDIASGEIERFIIGNAGGLKEFVGAFSSSMSYAVNDIWSTLSKSTFYDTQIVINPVTQEVFVLGTFSYTPLTNVPTHILYANFIEGMTVENLKWSTWHFPSKPTSMVGWTNASNEPEILLAVAKTLCKLSAAASSDISAQNSIIQYLQSALFEFSGNDGITHFHSVRANIAGSGNIYVTTMTESFVPATLRSWALGADRNYTALLNVSSEHLSVGFQSGPTSPFMLHHFAIFGKELWKSRPL